MKKVLLTFVALLGVVLLLVVGCGKENNETTTETTASKETTTHEKELVTVPEMEPVLIQINSIEEYRENVIAKSNTKFLTDYEIELLKEKGFNIVTSDTEKFDHIVKYNSGSNEVENYYYPIISSNDEEVCIWYITEYGEIWTDSIDNFSSDYQGKLHYDLVDEEIIQRNIDFTLTYNSKNGEIKKWSFNEVVSIATVPANSYWAGDCAKERHFFRSGSDIYRYLNSDASVRKVAYEVQEVVDCNYYYHHDRGLNPLFLMKDGSLKVYWDDKLYDILYEGGYHY